MRGTTNKQRIEQYDSVKAECEKLNLAMYDMINAAFGPAVQRSLKDFGDGAVLGRYTVRMSWRAMPLFLVTYCHSGQGKQFSVWTDDEIQDRYREHATLPYWQMVMSARNELVARKLAEEQAA